MAYSVSGTCGRSAFALLTMREMYGRDQRSHSCAGHTGESQLTARPKQPPGRVRTCGGRWLPQESNIWIA